MTAIAVYESQPGSALDTSGSAAWTRTLSARLEGIQLDRIFTDMASGKDTKRPQLDEPLHFFRDGDTLVVRSMDRLARNLDDLRLGRGEISTISGPVYCQLGLLSAADGATSPPKPKK